MEHKNAEHFKDAVFYDVPYEEVSAQYTVPARITRYRPDFVMIHNGIVIEVKGIFPASDRQKHILIRNDYPDLDVRFVFQNPNTRISKQSATTYAKWCEHHGFQFAKALTPLEWIAEPPEPRRMAAMRQALGL